MKWCGQFKKGIVFVEGWSVLGSTARHIIANRHITLKTLKAPKPRISTTIHLIPWTYTNTHDTDIQAVQVIKLDIAIPVYSKI